MSEETAAWANAQTTGCAKRKQILRTLSGWATPDGIVRYVDADYLQSVTEIHKRTIQRKMNELEDMGLIRRVPQFRKDGSQDKNAIELVGYQRPLGLASPCDDDVDDLFEERGGVNLSPPPDNLSSQGDGSDMGGVTAVSPLNRDSIDSPPCPPNGGLVPPKGQLGIETGRSGREVSDRGKRLPEDWQPPAISDLPQEARVLVLKWPSGAYQAIAGGFKAHYLAATGRKARSRDWLHAFSGWLIRDHAQVMRSAKAGVDWSGAEVSVSPSTAHHNETLDAIKAVRIKECEQCEELRSALKRQVGPQLYEQWFRFTAFEYDEITGPLPVLRILVASSFQSSWLADRFRQRLIDIVADASGFESAVIHIDVPPASETAASESIG